MFSTPVILCPVHRILWQQVTNLINKFALLLHKYRFTQDSRNKSENDWYRRCLLNTICKFFKYPSPADKSATSPAGGEVGRSMIEMLGVLVIIGVLSVGGIAGYSKAMEKYKIDKALNEYNMVIFGLIEHFDDFFRIGIGDKRETGLANEFVSLNLIPNTWEQINNIKFKDSLGNYFDISDSAEDDRIFINLWMGGTSKNQQGSSVSDTFSTKLCTEIFSNLAQPLHGILHFAIVYRYPADGYTKYYLGDKYCGSGKCIRDMGVREFYDVCSSCNTGNELCTISLSFKP